jgi:hypothetical protein
MGPKLHGEKEQMSDVGHHLPADYAQLLRDAVDEHAPELAPLLAKLGVVPLSEDEREALRGALADELASTGMTAQDEPNERGFQIEDIIDRLGPL